MCKFHQDVARDIATVNGTFIPSHYSIALLGVWKYILTPYVGNNVRLTGTDPNEMLTQAAQNAYATSGLKRSISDILEIQENGLEYIRSRIRDIGKEYDLSPKALNIPPLAIAQTAFFDYAANQLHEGDPSKEDYRLVTATAKKELQPLLTIAQKLLSDAETERTFRLLLEAKVGRAFEEAPEQVARGEGSLLHRAWSAGRRAIGTVTGGLLTAGTSHIGCAAGGMLPAVATGMGSAVTMGAGLGISALFNGAGLYAWHEHLGGKYKSPLFKASMAAGVGGLMVAVNLLSHGMHHHGAGHSHMEHMSDINDDQVRRYIGELKVSEYENLQTIADDSGMSVEDYIRTLCLTAPGTQTASAQKALTP